MSGFFEALEAASEPDSEEQSFSQRGPVVQTVVLVGKVIKTHCQVAG
jgi:hypothetical protein